MNEMVNDTFKVAVITLFPEMFTALTESGITRRAFELGLLQLKLFNPRDFTVDKHRTVDDRPYGGGPGMVMRVEPLAAALGAAKEWCSETSCCGTEQVEDVNVIYLSPQGRKLDQPGVEELVAHRSQILIAGRYEGIDERFIDAHVDQEWSIGDYVLSGGELPAMVVLDVIIRKLPGALGDSQSAEQDSFEGDLLDCPHYTRPEVSGGVKVPDILLSGDHKKIEDWRLKQALGRTFERRPDMLSGKTLTADQNELLQEYLLEQDDRKVDHAFDQASVQKNEQD
ncbi:MAG: tRNA (guanine37-N1)-methyltransferase [Lentisphaeria bacterium]|jgi:tRNA (guanine37-N1)-methyltransferase